MADAALAAPIALFAFRRPEHTRRTLAALQANAGAADAPLYVFCDAPRDASDQAAVDEVRRIAERIEGFASVEVVARSSNLGLARSIISGVGHVLERHGRVVVVEDDLVTSPSFLAFMNAGLATYADDRRVASIHGYVYPVGEPLPETFFLRGADCWGWATWSRAWAHFEPDAEKLLAALEAQHLLEAFDLDGRFGFSSMLRQFIAGENNSWAIRWHASCFLADVVTLYPGRSLVQNIGFDNSGTNCVTSDVFATALAIEAPRIGGIPVVESAFAREAVGDYLKRISTPEPAASLVETAMPPPSVLRRTVGRLRRLVGRG